MSLIFNDLCIHKLWHAGCLMRTRGEILMRVAIFRLSLPFSLLFATSLFACAAPKPSIQPADWDSNLRLNEAADINPDPHIVEINLDARVAKVELGGKQVEVFTYGGTIPGPLIRANVGDRLIVHFTNHLSVP